MALYSKDFREIDEDLPDYLHAGRVIPVYARGSMVSERRSRSLNVFCYRVQRLVEHDPDVNIYETWLYEFVIDSRVDGNDLDHHRS